MLEPTDFPRDPRIGFLYKAGDNLYRWVKVAYGAKSGRWAYWRGGAKFEVVVDTLANPSASKFAGMLAEPWNGVDSTAWVQVSGEMPSLPEPRRYIEDIERSEGRYERNDVDSIRDKHEQIEE